jgi:sulfatase maturation enzyme AslB (radical SAM superfamily)
MNVQSLSIHVPGGCPNRCQFCVSRMHQNKYPDLTTEYNNDYVKRLLFARDNNCNTLIFTGSGEPLVNLKFIEKVCFLNSKIISPFKWIEIQTSGYSLSDINMIDIITTLKSLGITTISLSLSSVWNDEENAEYNGMIDKIDIEEICFQIKRLNLNLRLSLNMTDYQMDEGRDAVKLFNRIKTLNADQVTFRKLYCSSVDCKENEWIRKHAIGENYFTELNYYIKDKGVPLEHLPFGAMRYSVDRVSIVVDDDCMAKNEYNAIKYLILRPNCKLYTRWDDDGSLLF